MKGKSRVVKLSLHTVLLEQIRQRPEPERPQVVRQRTPEEIDMPGDMRSILQSDVVPKPNELKSVAEKEKDAKTYRVRVEEDEAYSTRKRNPEVGGPAKPGRPRGSRRFEEITLDSDEEFGAEDDEAEHTSRPRGRASNWLARRNEGEEDLPTELPTNFREGDLRPNREKERERNRVYKERRQTMPSKSKVGTRPVGRPPKKARQNSTGDVLGHPSDEDGVHEPDESSETFLLAQQAATAALKLQRLEEAKARAEAEAREAETREAEIREVEENLRAKMALFPESDDEERLLDDFLGDLPVEEESLREEILAEPVHSVLPKPSNPILSGLNEKKIRIAAASVNRKGNTTSATKSASITKKASAINLSDTESEDEIPASAPIPKKPLGRPPGRPSMVPTRGSSSGKRGRGRPRKVK